MSGFNRPPSNKNCLRVPSAGGAIYGVEDRALVMELVLRPVTPLPHLRVTIAQLLVLFVIISIALVAVMGTAGTCGR